MNPDTLATVVTALVRELATELDLHYAETDFPALQPAMEALEAGARLLVEIGHPEPDAMTHIRRRYRRTHQ